MVERRQTADSRREAIVKAAIHEFAARGLYGSSTERIAQAVGISQPYIFRLFETKIALFLAAQDHVIGGIERTFERAALERPDAPLQAMAESFEVMLRDRDELRVMLQGFASAAEPELHDHILGLFQRLSDTVERLANEPPLVIKQFFAYGMLHIVSAAMGKELDFNCAGPDSGHGLKSDSNGPHAPLIS
jgi:AcrR family transcriptional regulator